MADEKDMGYPEDEEKRLQFWKRQITHAKAFYEPYFLIGDTLKEIHDNVASNFREKAADSILPDPIARVKAGIIYAWIEQSISNLQDRNPKYSVTAQNQGSVEGAPIVQAAINYWHEETHQYEHDDRCLLDSFIYHWFVKKIGWKSRIEEAGEITLSSISSYVEDDPVAAGLMLAGGIPLRATEYQDHEAMIEMCVGLLQDPTISQMIKDEVVTPYMNDHQQMLDKPQADQDTSIQYDAPYGVRWNPRKFLMSPYNEHGLLDAPFVAFGWCKRLYDVKNDPMFKNTEDLNASARSAFAPGDNDSPLGYDDFGEVQGWEIWARNFPVSKYERRNLKIVLCEDHDKFLQYDEEWPFENIEDYPACVGTFQHGVDAWVNKPLLSLAGADNMQMLVNEMLDSILSVVRKQKNVFLYDPEAFAELGDGVSIEDILQAPEGTAIGVPGLAQQAGEIIRAVQFNQVPEDKTQMANIIQNMIDRVLGTAEPLRSRSSDTATQAAIIERRITAREDRRANIFKRFQIDTARKFWQLHQQFLPDRQFKIDPRTDYWAAVSEEVAKGEYQFKIDISSAATAQNTEFDRWQKALNITAGVIPMTLQLYNTAPNLLRILEQMFVKGLGIQDVENYLPIDAMKADKALAESLQDPLKAQQIMMAMSQMKQGGSMQSNLPINPQLYASQPQSQADALTRSQQTV